MEIASARGQTVGVGNFWATFPEEEVKGFYEGFANGILWPLFHDLLGQCNFDPSFWYAYLEVNEKFADCLLESSRKDDFRREIMNYIGALAVDGKTFNYRTNERLHKALELKLFEDQKDSIKLKNLVSSVVDKETQEKIDLVKDRLMKNYGYCETCSTDVLNFVASIFARGDAKE